MSDHIDSSYLLASQVSSVKNTKPQKQNTPAKKSVNSKSFAEIFNETKTEMQSEMVKENFSGDTEAKILEQLQDAVFSAGDTLKQKTTLETIQNYKKAISDFLNYMVEHTYDFKSAPTNVHKFRKPKSSTIKVINEKLEQFTRELISNQLKQLEILQRIDEIRGLIVDMLR